MWGMLPLYVEMVPWHGESLSMHGEMAPLHGKAISLYVEPSHHIMKWFLYIGKQPRDIGKRLPHPLECLVHVGKQSNLARLREVVPWHLPLQTADPCCNDRAYLK